MTTQTKRQHKWYATAYLAAFLFSTQTFSLNIKRNDETCTHFQHTLNEIAQGASFPGATASIILPSGAICEAATGYADKEQETAMQVDHLLLAGSIGKTLVAAAAFALIQDGDLTYDQKAGQWLGDREWYSQWPNADTITIGHLLTHTSGVKADYIEQPKLLEGLKQTTQEDITLRALGFGHNDYGAALSGTEPLFKAGEGFHYTDVSYVLVALIIEEASNKSLEKVIQERLLDPLSLKTIKPQKRQMKKIAAGYIPKPYQALFGGIPEKSLDKNGHFTYDPEFEWGGGGYATTARDLAKWGKAWFSGQALNNDYLKMQRSNIDMRAVKSLQAGYGPGVQYLKDKTFGERYFHRGYMLGYIAITDYIPKYDIALSLMINTIDPNYTTYHHQLLSKMVEHLHTKSQKQ